MRVSGLHAVGGLATALLLGCSGGAAAESDDHVYTELPSNFTGDESTAPEPPFTQMQMQFMGGTVYTALVPDLDGAVAIAVGPNGRVDAYLCGGSETHKVHSQWICGNKDIATSDVAFEDTGRILEGTIDGAVADITITTADGTRYDVLAQARHQATRTNVYEANDAICRSGFIVIDDGIDDPTFVGTWCGPGDLYGQVTPVMPVDWDERDIEVIADTPIGERAFSVKPLVL